MTAYYNEIDPRAVKALKALISEGLIAPGEVDNRSIEEVTPNDIKGFTQCHFFAGIGIWSYALRQSGWPDSRPVWSGSCPCQPFSIAGKKRGAVDERHLWPAFHWLIQQCTPAAVFGEQVASADGLAWLDTVCDDLEATGYTVGAADLCAAGFGAPHIRQRLYWLAYSRSAGRERGIPGRENPKREIFNRYPRCNSAAGRMGNADGAECETRKLITGGGKAAKYGATQSSLLSRVAHPHGNEHKWPEPRKHGETSGGTTGDGEKVAIAGMPGGNGGYVLPELTGAVNGFWGGADWLYCRDGKLRPVEPGSFPLVDGAPARVGLLHGYGNAIVAPVAAGFIQVCKEFLDGEAL
ncbi:Modification methylase AplI [Klebsiella variicola]|uniref:DNA cytosine methyltransferase n=1 Tax=Klebsiella variicola TaxID=244366 RepID=UPI00109CE794|nr:DNA cytosine methyltransferase [Klebsiella variicola]VGQ12889.1 Modification methylase AplI [Klebsiella variicola]